MKTAIIGYGTIGKAIKTYLDIHHGVHTIQAYPFDKYLKDVPNFHYENATGFDTIVATTPYFENKEIAQFCADNDINYVDITEDVPTTEFIKTLQTNATMIPQCGFAPGAVNIVAHNIASKFDEVHTIEMRGGALPRYPNNQMKYYFSWSPEGVINEYCNLCDVVEGGEISKVPALEGLEELVVDGKVYEAFHTSGGLSTLYETWGDKVKRMDYKTIRYPGHQKLMKFLVDDLDMPNNRENFFKLFKQSTPWTRDDMVVMYVKVVGMYDNKLQEATYQKTFLGSSGLTAIELVTASGACAVLHELSRGRLHNGFVRQDEINISKDNRLWVYSDE